MFGGLVVCFDFKFLVVGFRGRFSFFFFIEGVELSISVVGISLVFRLIVVVRDFSCCRRGICDF